MTCFVFSKNDAKFEAPQAARCALPPRALRQSERSDNARGPADSAAREVLIPFFFFCPHRRMQEKRKRGNEEKEEENKRKNGRKMAA
jgi:hypothetical protein